MSKTGLRDDKRQRFLARANDLTLIKQYFEDHQALSFKGLIGWGRGCVQTSIFRIKMLARLMVFYTLMLRAIAIISALGLVSVLLESPSNLSDHDPGNGSSSDSDGLVSAPF